MNILVLGIGNPYRGDDGAGPAVARAVRALDIPGIEVREASGEGTSLLEAWDGTDEVYLVDAVRSGALPGTVVRFRIPGAAVPRGFFHYSTHAFSVAEAIALGCELGLLPPRMTIIGIEGESFRSGEALSAAVATAVGDVARTIAGELRPARSEPVHA